ncbi:MAG: hypothetical protein Q8M23_02750, partial [Bacteroidales bacterium]|nr:hypothetical protein [Bacteroidales bacterium]
MKSVSYSRIIYTLLLLSLGHVVAAQTTKTSAAAQYENAIIRAEQFMDQRNYRQAKAEYENALKIDISASYPRMKLQQIKQFYSDTQDETRYNQFIKQGDQFFSRQDYDKAHEQYEWALIMKPTENYPQGRIKELEEAKILLLQKRNAYSRSVAIADSLYAKKDYRQAINEYLYASGLLPTETYPRKKIDELNKIFDSARKELNTYDQAIADADQAYMIQDYFSALAGYRKALKMRPYESYPANMIQRISDAQADKLTAEETFAKLLATADQLFASSDYATARLNYEQALRLKPAETHPKKRITEIEIIFAKRAETAESLAKALELGEQHFEKKEYAQALSQFETAKKLDANNIVAGERISTIRDILKQTADFESIVNQADNLFNESAYADARKKYEEALLKRPGHTHSATRIAEIDAVLAYLAEQEQTYQQAITRADVANKAKEYQTALTQYRLAGSIKPDESYPILQISSINAFLQQEDDNRKAFE